MLTAEQKIKKELVVEFVKYNSEQVDFPELKELSDDTVEENYQTLHSGGYLWDAINELREGEVETDIGGEYSRHYESKSVAKQMLDGSWVGWTYWYGGGKHGEPWAIEWMSEAYELDVTEKEKLVTVRTFKKVA